MLEDFTRGASWITSYSDLQNTRWFRGSRFNWMAKVSKLIFVPSSSYQIRLTHLVSNI